MDITLIRYDDTGDATKGILLINGKFECYTLEDEHRDVKVMGETRIGEGIYNIELRRFGGHHERYSKLYDFHDGMLQIMDVPKFTDILIHTGVTEKHTMGCILVGTLPGDNATLIRSRDAYRSLYPKVLKAFQDGEEVKITVTRIYNPK